MQGWVKLHRKLLESSVITKSAYLHIWVTLLLMANHKKTTFIFNDKEQTLLPGQVLTGRKKLAKITRLNEFRIERILKLLENAHQIAQQKTSKFRIITIINWEKYQAIEELAQQNAHQVHNNCTSGAHQTHTYKNDKNEKNEKNHRGGFQSEIDSQKQMIQETLKKLEAEGEL